MQQKGSNTSRKVLVVDDDAIIRDMMVDILDFEGLAVCTARHGLEALEILRGEECYLVFLDLMMPVLSGQEVCAILKAEPELCERHIFVLMSALDTVAEASSVAEVVDGIMPKPFSVDDVLKVVESFLGYAGV
ncbi:MAG TPA: response regulator [Ktedonobacteraceae bacterium]|nr:response regulator [Ktedonobacteraceae bacterium]